MYLLLPSARVITLRKTHIEALHEKRNDHTHLRKCQVLPSAVGVAGRERDESRDVIDDGSVCAEFLSWFNPGVLKPSIRPECISERGEVAWVTVENVGWDIDCGILAQKAGRHVRFSMRIVM